MIDQIFTPQWAANELFPAHFASVPDDAVFIEPTCGPGSMLRAIPRQIKAFGVEQDPALAERARANTGRQIITGDIFEVELPARITHAFGNPPFRAKFLDRLLFRLEDAMTDDAKIGFIVPAYFLQTDNRVLRWNRTWTIETELLPRTVFPRLSKPIVFAVFSRDPRPKLRGMRLYFESDLVRSMRSEFQQLMREGPGTWREAVKLGLLQLGGTAHLRRLYEAILSRRPTSNRWWKEKIRQTLQRGSEFMPLGNGFWKLSTV